MKILFAVSECVPFIKSGGLADVAGALPKELNKLGTEARVILPNYGTIPPQFKKKFRLKNVLSVSIGWRQQYCGLYEMKYKGVVYYFIDNEYYFKRDSLYGHYDDGERFSFFCRAVLEAIPYLDFEPDVIHSHDWHTGMISYLLNKQYRDIPLYKDIKTVFTIHNLQFQGVFPYDVMTDLLQLHSKYFGELEFYGNINFMKAALISSDKITTVSETYKNEIQYPFFGEKLDGLLRSLDDKLVGIVNGIDDSVYNPAVDKVIKAKYDVDSIEKKAVNKKALQKYFGLKEKSDVPIVAMVTRLTSQKGVDLVRRVFYEMINEEEVQFILVGSGNGEYEYFFRQMEELYKDRVRAYIGFNEDLAHKVYAGADLFLMPSLFEPCGLGQLIAMQYGTIPVVRETGGLNDTVQAYDEETGTGNGFTFTNFNAHDLLHTYKRALHFYNQKDVWNDIVKETMGRDYSWRHSAKEYNEVYKEVAKTN